MMSKNSGTSWTISTKQALDSAYEEKNTDRRDVTWFDRKNFQSILQLWELEMRIYKVTEDDAKARFVFQRLRQSVRMKVSQDLTELNYESLISFLKVNYGFRRKMTLRELRDFAVQRRGEEVEEYFRRVYERVEGRIDLGESSLHMAILEGLDFLHNRTLKGRRNTY